MQWSLFLLLLMGQCSFFMCHLHEYHFVKEKKTWTEAQKYCREHHTDLATVSNMTDMKRLPDSARNQDGAWIGLYSDPKRNERGLWHWQWSLPGLESSYRESRWQRGEPNDYFSKNEKCVWMKNHKWNDASCSENHTFICYDAPCLQAAFMYVHVNPPPSRSPWPSLPIKGYSQSAMAARIFEVKWQRAERNVHLKTTRI
ncbi:L-selectin-like [Epinephelus moara]|uniref:L-selectin-like n=1 Tax=Epinephelus moara TaxID=300413 RepID=UPI00214F2631|nr:L-selectin-like [Epinephelus moara]